MQQLNRTNKEVENMLSRFKLTLPGSIVIMVMAFWVLSSVNVAAQDMLDLKIPKYEVNNVTMEEALRKLHAWGIQVCLEKVPRQEGKEKFTISVNLEGASVREVLNALVSEDKRYAWERYRRMSVSLTNLINVFPLGAKEDPNNLMNIKAREVVIKDIRSPEGMIPEIPQMKKRIAMAWRLHEE